MQTLGLFSLLDCMVGRPLSELLPELGLKAQIREALLGQARAKDPFRLVLDLCLACESVDDSTISAQAEALELSMGALSVDVLTRRDVYGHLTTGAIFWPRLSNCSMAGAPNNWQV